MKKHELNEHYDVAIALSGRGQEVYDIGDFSVILEDVKAKRVEGTRSYNASSDSEYYGYNEVSYTFIAAVYSDDVHTSISTYEEELTSQDENEIEYKIMETQEANNER